MGCLMVEADRHMKQLALGLVYAEGAKNYFDVVEANLSPACPTICCCDCGSRPRPPCAC